MYKIIGADGKEYGPVSTEQLRQWLTEGRVNNQTRVLAEGGTPPTAPPLSSIKFSPSNSDQTAARESVRGPAIFILVLSILNIITSVISCVWLAYESRFMTALGLPEQTNQIQTNMKIFFSVPATVIGFFLAVACLIGSLRMMKLQSHNFAIATAIMMLIPCSNCCCFLNIGAGIWALVILQKPEIKSSFE
jgi:hypothetical protein